MKANTSVTKLVLATVVCSALAIPASAVIAYNNPNPVVGTVTASGGPSLVGNAFTVLQPINVTAVGVYDHQLNGFSGANPVQVAIYSLTSGGAGLASAWSQVSGTFATFDQAAGAYAYDGSSAFLQLSSPVELQAGTYAIVAANYGIAANPYVTNPQNSTFVRNWTVDMLDDRNGIRLPGSPTLSGSFESFAGGWSGTGLTPRWAATTLDFTPVPEASHFAIAGVGLLGLVYVGRSVWQRRKVVA